MKKKITSLCPGGAKGFFYRSSNNARTSSGSFSGDTTRTVSNCCAKWRQVFSWAAPGGQINQIRRDCWLIRWFESNRRSSAKKAGSVNSSVIIRICAAFPCFVFRQKSKVICQRVSKSPTTAKNAVRICRKVVTVSFLPFYSIVCRVENFGFGKVANSLKTSFFVDIITFLGNVSRETFIFPLDFLLQMC